VAPEAFDLAPVEKRAVEAAAILRALANERRLMILCGLAEWGEANVTSLAKAVGLSRSAFSQHLTKMREEGLVDFRRESRMLWYRIADPPMEGGLPSSTSFSASRSMFPDRSETN